MSETVAVLPPAGTDTAPPINPANLIWVGLALAVLVVAIQSESAWLLNFVHVMAGVLWTGIDLFMGFVMGPIMRRVPPPARRAIVLRLMPKMLFLMPTLATLTATAGWFHARQLGLLELPWPAYGWVAAALVLVTLMTIVGFAFLLPTNLRVYFELRKDRPDIERIKRLMSRYIVGTAAQGVMQVAIILVMAKFVTGIG